MAMDYDLAIGVMALMTFYVRYAFFSHVLPIKINPTVQSLLMFTAPCILTAMIIPIMFKDYADSQHGLAVLKSVTGSVYFQASVITVFLSLFVRHSLLVIFLGMVAFYGLKFFFN